jgi:hypothetical protein
MSRSRAKNWRDQSFFDGVWRSDFKIVPHEERIYRKLSQPERGRILAHNAELRKNAGVIKDLSFARHSLTIPLEDYEVLRKKYPVLDHGSQAEQQQFWLKFLKSSESLIYRVG